MAGKRYLLRAQETPWKSVDDEEGVLLKLKDGTYYTINGVGLKIWELSNGTRNSDDIASEIANGFSISVSKAKKDMEDFVSQLKKEELITESPSPLKK